MPDEASGLAFEKWNIDTVLSELRHVMKIVIDSNISNRKNDAILKANNDTWKGGFKLNPIIKELISIDENIDFEYNLCKLEEFLYSLKRINEDKSDIYNNRNKRIDNNNNNSNKIIWNEIVSEDNEEENGSVRMENEDENDDDDNNEYGTEEEDSDINDNKSNSDENDAIDSNINEKNEKGNNNSNNNLFFNILNENNRNEELNQRRLLSEQLNRALLNCNNAIESEKCIFLLELANSLILLFHLIQTYPDFKQMLGINSSNNDISNCKNNSSINNSNFSISGRFVSPFERAANRQNKNGKDEEKAHSIQFDNEIILCDRILLCGTQALLLVIEMAKVCSFVFSLCVCISLI